MIQFFVIESGQSKMARARSWASEDHFLLSILSEVDCIDCYFLFCVWAEIAFDIFMIIYYFICIVVELWLLLLL